MSGYAEAELVYVAPSAAGTLQTLAVARGDRVKRGQLLYSLDVDSEAISRDAARARSEQAAAQADDLRKGKRPLELKQIDEQLVQAQATLAGSSADTGAQPQAGRAGLPCRRRRSTRCWRRATATRRG